MKELLSDCYYKLKTAWYYRQLQNKSTQQVFEFIHRDKKWGTAETVSGSGSTLQHSEKLRAILPVLLQRYAVSSVLDIPCGDMNWMQTLLPHLREYVGADIVPSLVAQNQARFPQIHFQKLDLTIDTLPACQLILCRDCMVHLSNHLVMAALENIRQSGAQYLLATTFPSTEINEDIPTGAWRPINLEREPFNLPKPIELIHEYDQKYIALWQLRV